MRYMMLIYTQEKGTLSEADKYTISGAHRDLMAEAREKGLLQGAEPLQPTASATTVRRQDDGKIVVTDGPFAETKEQLAGYYILELPNLDEAIEWAARIETACGGMRGCVEIRPFRAIGAP
jgi:hypothetical protein